MTMLRVIPIKAFSDNYIWAIVEPDLAKGIVVDPGQAEPVIQFFSDNGLVLDTILVTHHHFDHIGGIDSLIKHYPHVDVYGPVDNRIARVSHQVWGHQTISLPAYGLTFKIIDTPGHTNTHICFFEPQLNWLFCGDTLFSAGCGRLFEGTARQMLTSLQKLSLLPDETKVFCAHEYTKSNLEFASTIEPNNQAIKQYHKQISNQAITLPSTISREKTINPFLRTGHQEFIQAANTYGLNTDNELSVFAAIRELKDRF